MKNSVYLLLPCRTKASVRFILAKAEFSVSELQTLKHEFQQSSNALSETLVRQLREKDELLREKQVRDDFISSLLAVSRKQKQQEVSQTSKRKKILSHVFGHVEPTENKVRCRVERNVLSSLLFGLVKAVSSTVFYMIATIYLDKPLIFSWAP